MLSWTIQVTAVSLCFIAVIHYLYIFFKTTLTVPKVKDLVNRPQQQYDELFKGFDSNSLNMTLGMSGNQLPGLLPGNSNSGGGGGGGNSMTTSISSLPPLLHEQQPHPRLSNANASTASAAMKDELKQFVKKLNGTHRA
jgi:hypothetical protein